jgi:3-oxoadipate enol-lactonase
MTTVHQESGFYAFQKFVASFSFPGDFYNENRDRLLGDNGTWADLNGNLAAHERYVHACNNHDSRERLPHIKTPSLVLHALLDSITTARHTQLIEDLIPNCIGVTWPDAAHVVAGKEQRMRFDALLKDFLEAN